MRESRRLQVTLFLIGVLAIGASFRFVGLNWGEGQPIHPDEEFLRQVVSAVELPDRWSLYLDTANSPLNPYNRGHGFFVYGTLPLFLTRAVAEGLDQGCGVVEPAPLHPARWLAPALLGRPAEGCSVGAFSGAGARMVGRALAAVFDLGCLFFVFLLGQRLCSSGTGLLGALLYALAAFPIQQAHFFTVDAFANLFVAATLYLVVRAAQSGGWGAFALAGLTTGLGMACKISVWPLGLLVLFAGWLWWWRRKGRANEEASSRIAQGVLRVLLAGVLAAVAFRLAQPYAFLGPGFFGLRLNPKWLQNMAEIRSLMSGAVDTYPGHQWTNRTPLVFPWINMVFWGLGLPLGLIAWAGWLWAGVDLLRRWRQGREWTGFLLPWLWASGYFIYQGTQWVKSMRYLLPVYPVLVLFAAWAVTRLVAKAQRPKQVGLAAGVGALTVVGALVWALALTSVYTRPHTRVAASRWIFEHVPAALTVHLHGAEGETGLQVVVAPGTVVAEGMPALASFQVQTEADLTGVTLNYVVDPAGDATPETVRVAVVADAEGRTVLAERSAEIAPPRSSAATMWQEGRRGESFSFVMQPTRLLRGTMYYVLIEVVEGGPIQLYTSVLATEHWDWAPPLRVNGRDPFGGMYQGLSTSSDGTLQLYYDDTLQKRESLLAWLDEADYIIVGSNRLYASIARLPTRYPLTIAYYRALFSGELGFELVADFTSYPAIGPFQFPDTEEPFPIPQSPYRYQAAPVSVPMPPAEEAFSVYDHPRVLVFRKTAEYSRPRAATLLSSSLLNHVVWLTPQQATRGVREPVFDAQAWAAQQAGGTWSDLFDRDCLLNRSLWAGAAGWYLATAMLGWMAFPLLFAALPCLRDRGYDLARLLGLLVVAYLTWLVASLHLLPNTRSTVVGMVGVLAMAGGALAWRRQDELIRFLRCNWPIVLVHEGLFLALFVVWTWVRTLNPDLWHPVVGGEKPMDFAYLNAVIKSTWFPPYDPWFAGGYINYYYFGFVLVGSLAKLLGIMPSIAYNLALSLFYALTGGAAFSVAFSLVGRDERPRHSYIAGFLAVLFVLVLGNLGDLRLLINGFRILGGEPTFQSTIPGLPELVQALRGLGMVLRGASLPFRPESPYWEPTRMIPADASGVGPITEFPAFTFLYADLHAHMLALPYTLFALALVLHWARGARGRYGFSLLIGGLVIGSLRAMNTWDYPTYLLAGLIGLMVGWGGRDRKDGPWGVLWGYVLLGGGLVGLTIVLFLPYIRNYVPAYTQFQVWQGPRTSLDIYLLLIGQFLFPLLTLLGVDIRRVWQSDAFGGGRVRLLLTVGMLGLFVGALALALLVPVAVMVIPGATLAVGLLLQKDLPVERRMVWLLFALALVLSLAVEVVVLKGDIGRMNTVFKFYLQIWISLAVGAAVALVWLAQRLRNWPIDLRQGWWMAMGILLAAMALFPIMGIPAKVNDRFTKATGPTLDGMAYMQYSRTGDPRGEVDLGPDYHAILWMQENIAGSPVVLEGLGAWEYLWGNRISIYTGLPAVVGWRWHQVQQRMAAGAGEVEQRHRDVQECYNTSDVTRAREILDRYNVRYVYVGPYERLYYDARGLSKFGSMDDLRLVYNQAGVRIYEVQR